MTNPDFIQITCYFLFYSVIGWLFISLFVSVYNKQWQNRGLLYGPWLPTVGIAAVLIQTTLTALPNNLILIFLVGIFFGGMIDFFARLVEEKYLNIQPSKYFFRSSFFNGKFDGAFTIGYGVLTVLINKLFNPFYQAMMAKVPAANLRTVATWLLGIVILDFLVSFGVIIQLFGRLKDGAATEYQHEFVVDANFRQSLKEVREGRWLSLKLRNLIKSYSGFHVVTSEGAVPLPELTSRQKKTATAAEISKSFASGVNGYKLFWVFLIASVLGFIVESVWCVLRHGRLESRQGLIYGPFSQVYGIGAVAMVVILTRLLKKGKSWVFVGSALLGGVVEIVLSYMQEMVFGSVSWDYNQATLGVFGGRTNLIYMLFWGVLGVFFIQIVYPKLSELIEAIPNSQGILLTWLIACFLIFDAGISAIAVYRWTERTQGKPPVSQFWRGIDHHYPDDYMKEIYPNMMIKK